ncbi:MAG: hypothetical protein B7Y89_15870 [Novosphingobium sp. 32-60-15]|uniref:hypothetical protein n=1 Tax=unclassified Novosphingobium TaxID=2644732 RepID=UPI000BC693DF|nr:MULTISPECIES: hypothetical protein [unclassified Novosphingobium]OYX60596.1 MAG: hypothetical protein B7Y89_15870 [Novosphingobium sp. 32-60-15]
MALKTADPRNARRLSTRLSSRFVVVKDQVAQMMEEGRQLNGAEIEALFRHELESELRLLVNSYLENAGHSSSIESIAREQSEAIKVLLQPDHPLELTTSERERLAAEAVLSFCVDDYIKQLNEQYDAAYVKRRLEAIGAPTHGQARGVARAQLLRGYLAATRRCENLADAALLDVPDVAAALMADFGPVSEEAKSILATLNERFRTIVGGDPFEGWLLPDDDGKNHTSQSAPPLVAPSAPAPSPVLSIVPKSAGPTAEDITSASSTSLPPSPSPALPCQFLYRDPRPFSELIEPTLVSLKNDGKWKGDVSQQRRIMQTFAWITGDKALGDYNHLDVIDFKEGLQSLPGNFAFGTLHQKGPMARPFADVSAEIATSGALKNAKRRKAVTVNRDMSTMATVSMQLTKTAWKTGTANVIVLDFKAGRTAEANKNSSLDLRPPWKRAHLQELFSSPLFTGCDGHLNRLRSSGRGARVYHDAAYYAPLFWYYTGACREEICGLEVNDVIVDSPVPHVWIRDNLTRGRDGEMAGEKREARNRLLPIPKELLRLGFVDYHAAIKAEGHAALFPELYVNPEKRGGAFFYDRAWQHMVNYIGTQMAIPVNADGKRSDIHSIRSLVSSCFEVDGINDNIRADIMGHARQGTNGKHYSKRIETEGIEVVLAERLEVMEKYIPNITKGLKHQSIRLLPMAERSRTGAGIARKTRSDLGIGKSRLPE